MLDYDGCLPSYIYMSQAKQSDVKHAQYMLMPRKSVIVSDRGYQDFKMMYQWKKEKIIFVMMLKKTIKHQQVKELALPEGKDEHIIKDEIIRLTQEEEEVKRPEKG